MAEAPDPRLTQLLRAWQQGDAPAGEQLVPLVYAELRRIARMKLGAERGAHTLQATALVHEAWLRLMQQHGADWQSRGQFFAIAATAMRRILVDHARRRQAAKRGSGEPVGDVDELADVLASPVPDDQLVALDGALQQLALLDERQAQVVELRFFGGLSVEETGEVLVLSPTTVKREWATARLWLMRAIQGRLP
jgi:RNA polymerase sigma factor (TIGR02999 family)